MKQQDMQKLDYWTVEKNPTEHNLCVWFMWKLCFRILHGSRISGTAEFWISARGSKELSLKYQKHIRY